MPQNSDEFVDENQLTPRSDLLEQVVDEFQKLQRITIAASVRFASDLHLSLLELRTIVALNSSTTQTPTDVAAEFGITSGTVTALIDRLEARGFVRRRTSSVDRRRIELTVSADGHEIADRFRDIYLNAFQRSVCEPELRLAADILHRLSQTLSAE